jgi:uncharacterized protein YdeI (YjbR/CyaY-like superfamily)
MATTDPRIDAYIDAAADFSKPILRQLRTAVHDGCPGAVETIKWGFPHFMHGGGILCYMAAFKQHCSFGFRDPKQSGVAGGSQSATDQFGRIKSLQDLPAADALRAAVARAVAAIDRGGKVAAPRRAAKPAAETPADLQAALQAVPAALACFERFAPGQRREYVEWISEAKRAETRSRRIVQAVEWISEGKTRHWKYQTCQAPQS